MRNRKSDMLWLSNVSLLRSRISYIVRHRPSALELMKWSWMDKGIKRILPNGSVLSVVLYWEHASVIVLLRVVSIQRLLIYLPLMRQSAHQYPNVRLRDFEGASFVGGW